MKMSPMKVNLVKISVTKIFLATISTFMLATSVIADDAGSASQAVPPPAPLPAAPAAAPAAAPVSGRSKQIQFDDSVVEGMNKSSKDSLETVSKNEDPNRAHLYHKRADFKPELRQFSSEVGSQ